MTAGPPPHLHVPGGQVLFRPGQDCTGFVIVHEGTIRVSLTAENGREIILYRVRPGEVCLQTFGCLVNQRPYAAEGVAETDLALEVVPAGQFEQRLASDAAFRTRLLRGVATRFADMEQLVENVALTGLSARLARSLLRLRDAGGQVAATHEALAAEIGSGRAAVSRGLATFARAGLVELARGHLVVVDAAGLEALSHELE